MVSQNQLNQAVETVNVGGIIAYPTESVFGLGCNPFSENAVKKLLLIKKRSIEKGLILIASHIQQVLPLIKPIESNDLARALKTWPGHHTWIFPKSNLVPFWISGQYDSIAIRVSSHPVVTRLCQKLNSPLVSTSANKSNHDTLDTLEEIHSVFGNNIDYYLDAPVGKESKPSTIHDAHSNTIIR